MDLGDILAADGIIASLDADGKKSALQTLANRAAQITGVDAREIFETLLQRERLGSTGYGRGVAIPHVKLRGFRSLVCLFARARQPIDFEAQDSEPVDLFFLLLAPDHAGGDHLKALARIARIVREPALMERLRKAPSAAELRKILTLPATSNAA